MGNPAPMFAPLRPEEAAPPVPQAEEWRPIFPVPADAPQAFPKHRLGTPSAWWKYFDAMGNLLDLTVRFDPPSGKQILPLAFCEGPNGKREWRWQSFPEPRPLYGLDRLAQRPAARVLIVEGEKTADAAARLFPDLVAVTWPGGAKAADKAGWSPLAGRDVVLWPDADDPGRKAMEALAGKLFAIGAVAVATVKVPSDFPQGWDLADKPPEGWTAFRIGLLADNARMITPELDDAILDALARLSPLEYDRRREAEAQTLGIRLGTLDDEIAKLRAADKGDGDALFPEIEPWPHPVEGAGLLVDLAATFARFVVLPEGAAEALALWTLHAHAHDAATISPILAALSPEKRCGKTTLLSLLGALAPRPLTTAHVTAAVVFRAVEKWRPTLLIDEADSFLTDNEELRGVLNSGHNRLAAFVLRCVGEDFEPQQFGTWSPKAIALIGALPGTLADRSVTVRLRRKRLDETVSPLRFDRLGELKPLACRAARWAADHIDALRQADPDVPRELHDRAADNWRALIAIADLVGESWPDRARAVARSLSADTGDGDGPAVQLLADVQTIFTDRGADRIASADLAAALTVMEDRPWPEWRHGKPITPRQVARLLARFGIAPGTIREGVATAKGYHLEAFADAFGRYLLSRSVTTSQVNDSAPSSDFQSVTPGADVTDRKQPKPALDVLCDVVTDQSPWEADL